MWAAIPNAVAVPYFLSRYAVYIRRVHNYRPRRYVAIACNDAWVSLDYSEKFYSAARRRFVGAWRIASLACAIVAWFVAFSGGHYTLRCRVAPAGCRTVINWTVRRRARFSSVYKREVGAETYWASRAARTSGPRSIRGVMARLLVLI